MLSAVYSIFREKQNYVFSMIMWRETKRFRRKREVKRCVFSDNAVFTKILLCTRILHLIRIFCSNSGPRPCLLLNDAKKMGKTNYKISCMCTFKVSLREN